MADEKSSKGAGSRTTKSSAKKATTKKSTSRRTPAKRASGSSRAEAPRAEAGNRMSGARVAQAAADQLAELTTREVEGVTALERTDDGWRVELEVLELHRIPLTTDVMATYEVTLDTSGGLEGYRRVNRYVRGQAEHE